LDLRCHQFRPACCLSPGGAQALGPEGNLVSDFIFEVGSEMARGRLLHVCNAPSPAATSSLSIAEMIADKAEDEFGFQEDA